MITASQANQGDPANTDEPTDRGMEDRSEQTVVEWINAEHLRRITPEEIQLLAATGC